VKILQIGIENYGPFLGPHSFLMADKGLVLVLGDNQDEPRMNSNGSGKSSLFDALDWCLFGDIPKDDHVDSIIHDDASSVSVTAKLWDDDNIRELVITRGKARGKSGTLTFSKGLESVTALDARETQKLLGIELGLDREIFHATSFYGQLDAYHFAEVTEARRMELLSKILPELAYLDIWEEKAKVEAKFLQGKLDTVTAQEATIQTRISELKALETSLISSKMQWQGNQDATLVSIEQRGRNAVGEATKAKECLVGMEEANRALEAAEVILTKPMADVSGLDNQIQEMQKTLTGLISQEGILRGQLQGNQQSQAKLTRLGIGKCSQCGQPITAEHIAKELAILQAEVKGPDMAIIGIQNQAAQIKADISRIQVLRQSEIDKANVAYQVQQQTVIALRKTVEGYAEKRNVVAGWDREVISLREQWQKLKNEVNPYEKTISDNIDKITKLTYEDGEQHKAILVLADEKRYVDFWVDGFGNKGLRSYILDNRVGEMSDAANHWVKLLTGGTIWIRFETQKQGRTTKKLSNDLNIRVFRYNRNGTITERNYKSWSGGEKRRVSWAIDFGLSRLVAARAKKRWDTLILDEVFKHVDSAGGEAVVEMLQYLRKERSSIFVIEHDSSFQTHFEQRLIIRKLNGQATIVEVKEDAPEKQSNPEGTTIEVRKTKQAGTKKRRSVSAGKLPSES
jgi:DNA repair exonuclease SbcCD ATPase subunit